MRNENAKWEWDVRMRNEIEKWELEMRMRNEKWEWEMRMRMRIKLLINKKKYFFNKLSN